MLLRKLKMRDEDRTKEQLIDELTHLRQRVAKLEKLESERKLPEDILKRAEERYQSIFENAVTGIVQATPEGKLVNVNPAFARMCGFESPEEMMATISDVGAQLYANPEDRTKIISSYEQFGVARDFETQYRRTDGRSIWVSINSRTVRDENGKPLYYEGTVENITRRKQAEDALRENEELYRTLVHASPDAICATDPQGLITFTSLRALRTFGYSPNDDLLGRSILDWVAPEQRDLASNNLGYVLTEKGPRNREYTLIKKDGTRFIGEVNAAAFHSPDGSPKGILLVTRDITDRKQAEKALRESEELWQLALESAGDGVWDWNVQTNEVFFSRRWKALLGYADDEIGNTLDEWDKRVHPDDREQCYADLEKHFRGERPFYQNEHRILCKDGSYKCFLDRGKVIKWTDDGKPLRSIGTHTDITDRKRTDDALILANRQLNDIIEFLPDATAVIDKDKKFIAWNRAMEEMTGVSKEDMIGKGHEEGSVPFYGEKRPYLLDLIHTRDRNFESSYPYIKKKGNTLYAETHVPSIYEGRGAVVFAAAAPLFDSKDNIIGAIESIRDITEYKAAEEALRESQRRLQDIIDFLPDATLVIDKEGKVIAWNRAMEELTEVKAEDILGKGDYEYALPFYGKRRPIIIDLALRPQAEVEAKYMKVEREDSVLTGEAYMPALRGGGVYLFCKASILRDSKGIIVGAIESMHDITERRRAEESLARAEEKYRSIFENAMEGIYQTTLEGRCINANPALAKILGYDSPEELMNTITDISSQLYVNPEHRAELLRLIEQYGSAGEFETQYFRKDGNIAWVSLNMHAVYDPSEKVAYLEGTVQDITDRKALESRLVQAQKMEAIGTLAGGIAHDFNNILAAILGYTEIMKVKFDEPGLHGYLEQILTSCDRAKSLVAQILTFSRATEQERRLIDMSALIKESLKLLRAALPTTIAIHREISSDTHTVLADPTRMHQVLINLCTNAAYAMRESGGVLKVNLENLVVSQHAIAPDPDLIPGPYVRLTVSDTGTGIAPEVMHRIFDPFFTTKKTGEGTGLGLSVVYGIVKGFGGTVTVRSELGVGSIFSVYLPAIANTVEASLGVHVSIPKGNERILFVDDEETLTTMWCDILDSLGYKVTVAPESVNALEIFRDTPDRFDLVITDMTMPGMTGMDLSEEILKLRPGMPIILCTGFNELVTEEKAKAMGIRAFAMKPVNLRDLAVLIRKVLEKV